MDTLKLMEVLAKTKANVENSRLLKDSIKRGFLLKIRQLEDVYRALEVPEDFIDLYQSLVKRGSELQKEFKKKNEKELRDKIRYFLRYVGAALFDFEYRTAGLASYARLFIIMAALFMVLVPQFYGFVLPLVFVIPIFAGIRGLKKRSYTAFSMSLAVIPMALMVGITWIQYGIRVFPNLQGEVNGLMNQLHTSAAISRILVIGPIVLGVILLIISLRTAYVGYKNKDMFV